MYQKQCNNVKEVAEYKFMENRLLSTAERKVREKKDALEKQKEQLELVKVSMDSHIVKFTCIQEHQNRKLKQKAQEQEEAKLERERLQKEINRVTNFSQNEF
jgi:hypothetical protein